MLAICMTTSATFENGTTYRGIINIYHGSWAITLKGGASYVQSQLVSQGFSNVSVWLDPSGLPSDWPSDKKTDNSASGNTWVWIEGTWSQPTGQYPSGDSDFCIKEYWVQKQAAQPQQQPPPIQINPNQPSCFQNGIQCVNNSDCCSQYCVNNQCSVQPGQPQPNINTNVYQPTCASEGMSCDNLNCCDNHNLICQQDTDGYWGGGNRCFIKEDTQIQQTKDIQPKQKSETSSLWYILGAAVIGGIVTAVSIKALSNKSKSELI